MSLTSYRAAPPRGSCGLAWSSGWAAGPGCEESVLRLPRGLFRFGGDLLSHVLGRSTIGAAALNGRVRDGIGCFARAMPPNLESARGRPAGLAALAGPR